MLHEGHRVVINVDFILWICSIRGGVSIWHYFLSSAPPDTAKKKGRELNAPLTEGTAKRPCRRIRQAAPVWALARRGSYIPNSRFFGKAAAVLR